MVLSQPTPPAAYRDEHVRGIRYGTITTVSENPKGEGHSET